MNGEEPADDGTGDHPGAEAERPAAGGVGGDDPDERADQDEPLEGDVDHSRALMDDTAEGGEHEHRGEHERRRRGRRR